MTSREQHISHSTNLRHIPIHSSPVGFTSMQPSSMTGNFPFESHLQVQRMNDDMSRMYRDMNIQPLSRMTHDTWLNEDLRMDNPIITDPITGEKKFKLHFDLHQYKPEEISITTKDGNLTVSAKHEENKEGRSVNREYNRSYLLPETVNPDLLTSRFTPEGVLNIEALLPTECRKERVIPIEKQ